jgi:hypothetical protein
MKRHHITALITGIVLVGLLAACGGGKPVAVPLQTMVPGAAPETETPAPTETSPPTEVPPTATPTETPVPVYGPETYPDDVNPLTGLQVDDPTVLDRRPLLVKVSNESEQVRPWSGLAFADHVWEYQMEGFAQTRFTAVIYSQTPERVGSVRSARLIDVEELVDMYGGILVNSGASSNRHAGGPPRINELLRAAPWTNRVVNADFGFGPPYLVRIQGVPREGIASWHTLFAIPEAIWTWAAENGFDQRQPLEGLVFSPLTPEGGTPTVEAVVDYPGSGPKHTWRYDAASGRWISYTNDVQDGDTLTPAGEPLAFDNVVVLYAEHYESNFIEDEPNQLLAVGQELQGEGDAVLLRDGVRYDVTWRRDAPDQMIRFYDGAGNPIPFKPGTTFFNVVSINIWPPDVIFTP